jgi:hypothetical protein
MQSCCPERRLQRVRLTHKEHEVEGSALVDCHTREATSVKVVIPSNPQRMNLWSHSKRLF